MVFYMPTRLISGKDCLLNSQNEFKTLGKKALIITGKNSALRSGVLLDLHKVLSESGITYVIFDKIMENPTLDIVCEGSQVLLENACDFLIGIGGGSPIDAAKAISIMAANDLKYREIYSPDKFNSAYPLVAIPTTSGTGSEVTQYSVITDVQNNQKAGFGHHLCFPKISFLDPKYTLSMSETVTRDTAIDALSHLLEGLYSNKRNPLIYPIIFAGFKLIYDNLPLCLDSPVNLTYREKLQQASVYGGMVIAQTSTTLQHSIGYPLTTNFHVSHGKANGLVMQQIMELYYPHIKTEIDALFAFAGITKIDFYRWIDNFEMKLDHHISEEFIASKTSEVMQSRNMANNPFEVDAEIVKELFRTLEAY